MQKNFKAVTLATAIAIGAATFSGCTDSLDSNIDPTNGGSTPTEEMITISLYTGTADPNDIEPTRIRSNLVDEDIYDRDYVFAYAVDITSNQLTAGKTYYVEGTAGKDYLIPKLSDFSCSCKKCSQFAVFMKHELSSSDF